MKRRAVYAVIVIFTVMLCGCGSKPAEDKPVLLESQDNDNNTTTVSRQDIDSTDIYQAEVIPYIKELSFKEDGNLAKVYVKVGTKVQKGDLLAKLTNRTKELLDDYNEQKAALNATYFQDISTLQNDIAVAKLTGESTDEFELELKHKDELFQLENSQLLDKIDKLNKKLTDAPSITAPFDGEIVAVPSIDKGSYVGKGTSFLAIANPDKLQVACDYIAENNIKNLYKSYAIIDGNEYDIEYQAYSKEEISKKIEERIFFGFKSTGMVSKFNLKDADSSVQAGSYAVVCVVKGHRDNALTLPVNAIFTEGSGKYVYQMVDGSRVKTAVTIGITDSVNTEILTGIEEGATVYVEE